MEAFTTNLESVMCYITHWSITPKFWVKVSYRKIRKIMKFWKIAHFLAYYFRNISMFSDPIIFISTDSRGSRPERKLLPSMCYITHWSITPKFWVKVAYSIHALENSILGVCFNWPICYVNTSHWITVLVLVAVLLVSESESIWRIRIHLANPNPKSESGIQL